MGGMEEMWSPAVEEYQRAAQTLYRTKYADQKQMRLNIGEYPVELYGGESIPLKRFLFSKGSWEKRINVLLLKGQSGIGKRFLIAELWEEFDKRNEEKNKRLFLYVTLNHLKEYFYHHLKAGEKAGAEDFISFIMTETIEEARIWDKKRNQSEICDEIEALIGNAVIVMERKCLECEYVFLALRELFHWSEEGSSLLILSVGDNFDNQSFGLNAREYGVCALPELREEEIFAYVGKFPRKKASFLRKTIQENDEIIQILRLPKRLKMLELLYKGYYAKAGSGLEEIKNDAAFISFYIKGCLETAFRDKQGNTEIKNGQMTFYMDALMRYAWHKSHEPGPNVKKSPESFAGFRAPASLKLLEEELKGHPLTKAALVKARLLDNQGEFQFDICCWYLAARYIFEHKEQYLEADFESFPEAGKELEVFLDGAPKQMFLFLAELLDGPDDGDFKNLLNVVKGFESKGRALLLIEIISKSSHSMQYMHEFCDFTFQQLNSEFYDYSIFEAYFETQEKLKEMLLGALKGQYGRCPDNMVQNDNLKRRLVYYLGISRKGITADTLKDFISEKTHPHLKYHILRAVCENYKNGDDGTNALVQKYWPQIQRVCTGSSDPIINSDFDILSRRYNGKAWLLGRDESKVEGELLKWLDEESYYKRAHAADALGRRGVGLSGRAADHRNGRGDSRKRVSPLLTGSDDMLRIYINRLLERLPRELEEVERDRKCVKAISNITEALCELVCALGSQEKMREVIESLISFIDLARIDRPDYEDAYASIATGIEYMVAPGDEKLPFALGKCFRNEGTDHLMVLIKIFSLLLRNSEYEALWNTLQKQIESLTEEKIRRIAAGTEKRKGNDMTDRSRQIEAKDVTIGIVTALADEYNAVKAILTDGQEIKFPGKGAGNVVWAGTIPSVSAAIRDGGDSASRYVAVIYGREGNDFAALYTGKMYEHFPNLSVAIMAGIAGGIPDPERPLEDVRFGDIVISSIYGVSQHDYVKMTEEGSVFKSVANRPAAALLERAELLKADEKLGKRPWEQTLKDLSAMLRVPRPHVDTDCLYGPDETRVFRREDPERKPGCPKTFLGGIASGNMVVKNKDKREEIRTAYRKENIKAIEMEGAGVSDATWVCSSDYLIVRGICDYADGKKNDEWQRYAAVAAAAYIKTLIERL